MKSEKKISGSDFTLHHLLFTILGLLAAIPTGGCEKYQPLPLNEQAVDRGLAVPSDRDLSAKIADLKNPMLQPVQVRPDEDLTPDQAAILAVILNPTLRAVRDERQIAQAALLQAGILPNPQLTYSYNFNTGGLFPGAVDAYGIGLNWDITTLISHSAKVHAAEWSAQSVDLNIAWEEWQVAEAAKSAATDLMFLRAQRNVAAQVDDRLAENLKLVHRAVDLGLKTAIELAAAQSASQDAHAIVLQADRDVEHQLLMLKRALGVGPEVELRLKADPAPDARFTPPTDSELTTDLENHRLDLVALRQGYQSQEQTLVAACLDQFPRINLGFSRDRDNTNVRSIGLGVSVDIPLFDRNQGAIATEKANRQKLRDEYIARVFDARADIAQALADIAAIDSQITDAQAALPGLQKLVDVYCHAVDRGNADVLSYYEAWNALAQKNLDLLKLRQQLADNRVALEIASGRYFPDENKPATQPPATMPSVTSASGLPPSAGLKNPRTANRDE